MSALPQAESDGSERRVAPRLRILKRAQVVLNNRFSTIDCIVRNISATGALLTIEEAVRLPPTFDLRIADDKNVDRPAKLVYRRGMLAGIRFLDVPSEEDEQAARFGAAARTQPLAAAAQSSAGHGEGRASDDAAASASIHRIVPQQLPRALIRNFRWS